MTRPLKVSENPLGLVEFLRNFGVEELGSLFAYVPDPRTDSGHEAWVWLEAVRMFDVIVSGPWRVQADRAPEWLRKTHPKLFAEEPIFFEVYRLDRKRLTTMVNKLYN